jgi:hypothetical protein
MNGIQEDQRLESAQSVNQPIGIEKEKSEIPYGYCQCGCGGKTSVARQTNNRSGILKNQHRRFILGHHTKVYYLNPRWNGGVIDRNGYSYIYFPKHPFSTMQGYIAEHRIVAERALGKYLDIKHPVHHSNGKRADNVANNLVVCEDNAYHKFLHIRINAYNSCGNASWLKCPYCGKHDNPKNMYVLPHGKYGRHRSCRNKVLKKQRMERAAKS